MTSSASAKSKGNFQENFSNIVIEKLFKNYLLLITFIFVGAGIGLGYAILRKPEFKSNLTFALNSSNGTAGSSMLSGFASNLGLDLGGGGGLFEKNNIIEIIQSRRIIESVLMSEYRFKNENIKLVEYFLNDNGNKEKFLPAQLNDISFPNGLQKAQLNINQKEVLNSIYNYFTKELVTISRPDQNLNIIKISVKSKDEIFSKIFTDRLLEATDSFYREVCTKKAGNTLELLEKRAQELKGTLFDNMDTKSQIIDADLNPAFARAISPIEKKQFEITLYGEGYSELFKNLEIARYQYLKEVPIIQVIDGADFPMEKVNISKFFALATGAVSGLLLFMMIIVFKSAGKSLSTFRKNLQNDSKETH